MTADPDSGGEVVLPGGFTNAGRVTRVTEYDNKANMVPGMGVEFTDVDDPRRKEIEAFVARLRTEFEEA